MANHVPNRDALKSKQKARWMLLGCKFLLTSLD